MKNIDTEIKRGKKNIKDIIGFKTRLSISYKWTKYFGFSL